MEIIKTYLNQHKCDLVQSLNEATWFDLSRDDIVDDKSLNNLNISPTVGANVIVFQTVDNNQHVAKFCYIVYRKLIGRDGNTALFVIDKIVIDYNAVDFDILKTAFQILFQQNYGLYDRLQVGKINERIIWQTYNLAQTISQYLVDVCNSNQHRNPIVLN